DTETIDMGRRQLNIEDLQDELSLTKVVDDLEPRGCAKALISIRLFSIFLA
ncbi:unnamed protein product, partial [marine sediment metagenome]